MMFLEQDLKDNPDSKLQLSVLYFSLEESEEKIILSEIAKYLHTKYGITVSIKDIISVGKYNTISEDIIEKIKEAEEYVKNFLKNVTIFSSVRNPTGIFKTVRDFALKVGTYYDVNNNPLTSNEVENVRLGKGEDYKKISYYKKYNDRHFVIVLIDHVG